MNNNDERDYAEESDNRALLLESDEWVEEDGTNYYDEQDIIAKAVKPSNYLIVSESATQWVVWHIIHISIENVNWANEKVILPNLGDGYIWPQACHFWTFDAVEKFMNETVKLWEQMDESTEIVFI